MAKFQEAEIKLKNRLERARALLPEVRVSESTLGLAVRLALALGAEGHRADLVTVQAACALAALEGRRTVGLADIKRAAVLALRHRLRRHPLDDEEIDSATLVEQVERVAAGEPLPPPATEKKSL